MTFEEEMILHQRVFCSATIQNDPRKKKLAEEYYKERNRLFDEMYK